MSGSRDLAATGLLAVVGVVCLWAASRLTWPAPRTSTGWSPPPRGHSRFYDAYIHNRVPGHDGRTFWRERRAEILAENRIGNGGLCQGGFVCGGRSFATQVDHAAMLAGYRTDYDRLGDESSATTRCLCAPCHDYRTKLQRQGTNAYFHHWRTG